MSAERFYGDKDREPQLFPIASRAIEKAFPYNADLDDIGQALRQEAMNMYANNHTLYSHLTRDTLDTTYSNKKNIQFYPFIDGARFMHRILRHTREDLPIISKNELTIYDMENKRNIHKNGQDMKTFFAENWQKEFGDKKEHKELAHTIKRVGDIWTERSDEVKGGAYYVARAFQRNIEAQNLNNEYWDEIDLIRGKFPEEFE